MECFRPTTARASFLCTTACSLAPNDPPDTCQRRYNSVNDAVQCYSNYRAPLAIDTVKSLAAERKTKRTHRATGSPPFVSRWVAAAFNQEHFDRRVPTRFGVRSLKSGNRPWYTFCYYDMPRSQRRPGGSAFWLVLATLSS